MNLTPNNNKTPKENGRPAPKAAPAHRSAKEQRTRIQNAIDPQSVKDPNGKPKKEKGKLKPGVVIRVMLWNVLKSIFVVGCIGLMIGSIVAVQMVQYVVEATKNDEALLDLEHFQGAQTSYIMAPNPNNPNAIEDDDYIEYERLVGTENRIWVALDKIPQNLRNAVIATEDREFGNHHGVNFRRTIGALINEVIPVPGWKGGASTITQQLVKNITGDDVVEGENGITDGYKRKLREIFRAWGMHNRYSTDMILEAYLNTIGLSERLAGVEAGARAYFNKSVEDLTLAECAVIAGITQAPTYYSPIQNPENALKRRDDVIQFMLDSDFITAAEAQEVWDNRDLGLATRGGSVDGSSQSTGVWSYFTDKVYEDVITDLMHQKGWSRSEARSYVYNGGLKIYTTVDLNIQGVLDDMMLDGYAADGSYLDEETGYFLNEDRFPSYKSRMTIEEEILNDYDQVIGYQEVMPQMGVVIIDYNGRLLATSGGIGEKETSLSLNRSIGTLERDADGNLVLNAWGEPIVNGTVRQVGSTMKPVAAYALGIDYGIVTYSKMVMDAAIQPRDPYRPQRDPETGSVINDWPSNYSKTYRNQRMPVMSAIAESTNTVAAQVGMWVGRETMYDFLVNTLQITSLTEPRDVDLGPLVLGSQTYGMSAYELAGAYMMFGGNETYGVFNSLHCYTRVEDSLGNIVLKPEIMTIQAIDPQSGYVMNRLLNNVLTSGSYPTNAWPASPTAGGMKPEGDMPAVGKTGTTNEDNDRWFVGLTPYYVTSVWWGYDRDHTLLAQGNKGWPAGARRNVTINVWKSLMEAVQTDLEYKDFPEVPEGVVTAAFCTNSGNLASPGCPAMTGYYKGDAVPPYCNGEHVAPAEEPVA